MQTSLFQALKWKNVSAKIPRNLRLIVSTNLKHSNMETFLPLLPFRNIYVKKIQSVLKTVNFQNDKMLIDNVELVWISCSVASKFIPGANDTSLLERFSNECRKTKTEVITPANHNTHKLPNEPIRTRSKYT